MHSPSPSQPYQTSAWQTQRSRPLTPLIPSPPPHFTLPPLSLWMSSSTIKLVYECASLRSNPHHFRNVERTLTRAVQRSLLENSRQQSEKASLEIELRLEPSTRYTDLRGSYSVLKIWYRRMSTRAPNHSQADMDKVTKYYATLYQWKDPYPPG